MGTKIILISTRRIEGNRNAIFPGKDAKDPRDLPILAKEQRPESDLKERQRARVHFEWGNGEWGDAIVFPRPKKRVGSRDRPLEHYEEAAGRKRGFIGKGPYFLHSQKNKAAEGWGETSF